jgi:hypothetical protein
MSVAAELLAPHLPLASGEIMGVNPAYFLAGAAAVGALHTGRKVITSWNTTIGPGQVGVPLKKGEPIVRKDVTEQQIYAGESKYKILGPGFYYVLPFRAIEPVYVADQPDELNFWLDCKDGPHVTGPQVKVSANVVWRVSPDGDNPVRAITEVVHQRLNKKETTELTRVDENMEYLKKRVLGVYAVALSQTLTDRPYEELNTVNKYAPEKVEQETIERSAEKLSKYGVETIAVELMQITRIPEQVLGELIRDSQNPILATAAAVSRRATYESNGHSNGEVLPLRGEDAAAI